MPLETRNMSSAATIGNALQNINSQSAMSSSYGNERSSVGSGSIGNIEIEYASDPASGGFFHSDYKKHDDLKQMLDSNKDSLKLEAMKRIIGMVAKGKDASDLFPAVVKNVVSKNIEVKKLVYVYLVRYAEEQQDLALLSISTFQRALKDPNQLIRAGALRVLSSIRVSMIVPIVMLAIRDSASDMSPYVRKTAAHAIPKLFSLDVEQKDELITVIEKLLYDRTTLVVGSAVMAFEEVCPERVDLIHKNYRKLCNLLVDVDEWGQIIIINMLTRYARTQFLDPNSENYVDGEETDTKPFYEDSNSEISDNESENTKTPRSVPTSLDPDHRLLLRQTKPLLQSRNASVVMTVAQLYHHVAPRNEVALVAKALIRLLRSHKEVQSVVLTSIASMSTQRKCIFDVYMKSFFVRTSDATHIKLLKLEILTNLATVTSISVILREFQTYISSNDKEFVAATIQAIGRCAASIKEVTETCLSGLVHLLSNRDEYVVAESVVVIKQLLQTQAADHFEIISQMAKLLDFIAVPAARAAILWLIGEYNEKVPNIAPDVLRKLAKTFVDEEHIVKLQVLNLAVKLHLTNPMQTDLLCQYVLNLARYDQNYDIRDRARLLKHFVLPLNGDASNMLTQRAKMIFLAAKPAPQLESKYQGREQYQLGSLSHYLNMRANGYHDIPDFPDAAPDANVRNVEAEPTTRDDVYRNDTTGNVHGLTSDAKQVVTETDRSFYTDSDNQRSSEYSSTSSSSSDEESGDDDHKSNVSMADSVKKKRSAATSDESNSDDTSYSDDDDSSSSFSDESGSESSSEESNETERSIGKQSALNDNNTNGSNTKSVAKSNLDLLLNMNDTPNMGTILTPSKGFATALATTNSIQLVDPSYISTKRIELLSKMSGNGLAIQYRFTRTPHIVSASMVSVEFYITNTLEYDLNNITFTIPVGGNTKIHFCSIGLLPAGGMTSTTAGIDFNDSTQPIQLQVEADKFRSVKAILKPSVGELIRPVTMPESVFIDERSKLRGMNEQTANIDLTKIPILDTNNYVTNRILEHSNLAYIPAGNSTDRLHFAGKTVASGGLILLTAEIGRQSLMLTLSCEHIVIGSMLLTELRSFLITSAPIN